MTLQQLKYVIAIDRYRNFARAAEACEVTQPTLSGMLAKLEEELDVKIFERTNKRVVPTAIGARIIAQAERVVSEADHIGDIVAESRDEIFGDLTIAVGPSIAPYILPEFIGRYSKDYPDVKLLVREMKSAEMTDALLRGEVDVALAIGGNRIAGILEVPLYREKFLVYLAESCWRKLPVFRPENLEHENMWILKDAQCMRESAFSFCKAKSRGLQIYEAGNIETLIRIVDRNGGYTIIPEMHLPMLSESQRRNVRRIEGDYLSQRRVSLYFKDDYVREKLLNTITATMLKFMPAGMMEPQIGKYGVRI